MKNIKDLQRAVNECLEDKEFMTRLLLDIWDKKTPHFGGAAPHRYDDGDSYCKYCNRPRDWDKNTRNTAYFKIIIGE